MDKYIELADKMELLVEENRKITVENVVDARKTLFELPYFGKLIQRLYQVQCDHIYETEIHGIKIQDILDSKYNICR